MDRMKDTFKGGVSLEWLPQYHNTAQIIQQWPSHTGEIRDVVLVQYAR